ncbi:MULTISPECIES: hypothetical protein [Mesorhizobium]|uniref:Uncharacterized protein n=1 Tax=Mesorhizobium shonense TaxID=1209948 RepID=A0ABV2HP40_9HYPH|nr:hypothetical protein [Mesorhizobium sp.]RWE00619.1 MAG: hypothetical protein EOS40_14600 [Mesorhizobium sp.]TIS50967.1 MAG: hypothetical protein E5W96_04660 [Mesorhizobium sp.]TIU00207.1 MAG: hypothetical protein E5W55_03265 [Mesorhizobium sp.]
MAKKSRWKAGFSPSSVFETINKRRVQTDEKVTYQGFGLTTDVEILYTYIDCSREISSYAAKNLIRSSILEKTRSGTLSPNEFITIFDKKASLNKVTTKNKYHILTSLSYSGEFSFKSVTIDGCKIVLSPSNLKKYRIT